MTFREPHAALTETRRAGLPDRHASRQPRAGALRFQSLGPFKGIGDEEEAVWIKTA
jgi:hypothetical protein